jgi:tetratricopeptide (TPR) repeat protein
MLTKTRNIFVLLSFVTTILFASNMSDINYIRKEFNLAIDDAKRANSLYNQLLQLKPASNTLQYAYLGATEAILAKHAFNPFSKLGYVNSALEKLNRAVDLNRNDVEVRYMRYSVESNMPSYLGYSKHVEADKQMIIKTLSSTKISQENYAMYSVFAKGVIDSKNCNKAEEILLTNVIEVCSKFKPN